MFAYLKLALLLALLVGTIAIFGVDADRYDDCRGGWQVPGYGNKANRVQARGGLGVACASMSN